jgi:hypothetical protein
MERLSALFVAEWLKVHLPQSFLLKFQEQVNIQSFLLKFQEQVNIQTLFQDLLVSF